MNDIVKRTWTALDGDLVFDIAVNRGPAAGVPSTATIRCQSSGPEERDVVISEMPGPFDFRFRSGCHVNGALQLRRHTHIDGVDSIGVFADIRFGIAGQHVDTHFVGLMAVCPSPAA